MIRSAIQKLNYLKPRLSLGQGSVRPISSARCLSTNPKRTTDDSEPVEIEPTNRISRGSLFRSPFGFDDSFFHDRDPFAPFFRHRDRFFDDFFAVPNMMRHPAFPEENSRFASKRILRSSPGYQIQESATAFEITVDLPENVKASDLHVELENDGRVLHLTGQVQMKEDEKTVSHSWFDKRFSIGANVNKEGITANLHNGVLTITAPKLEKEDRSGHVIKITENADMTKEDLVQDNYSDAFDESDWAEAGKEKEELKNKD